MELEIKNRAELSAWLNERRQSGNSAVSVKAGAPDGSTYSDGTLIKHTVNIGWRDCVTGEFFTINYAK